MCKLNRKSGLKRIDPCMKLVIKWLRNREFKPVACCCGHGKYPMTILVKNIDESCIYDIFSQKIIPRKKRFYKKDEEGYYYIPEVLDNE